jgi:hypothetical protein
MAIKILDSARNFVELNENQSMMLLEAMKSENDPRISACIECNSAVVATEPFSNLIDELSTTYAGEIDILRELMDLAENSEAVHLYILEDNECVHLLWRDPIAGEWTEVTGEKRLHH